MHVVPMQAFGRFGEKLGPILQEIGVDDPPEVYPAHTFVSGWEAPQRSSS